MSQENRWYEQPLPAVAGISLGMALIPLNDALIKLMSARLPVHEIMALRAGPALLLACLIPGAIIAVRKLNRNAIAWLSLRAAFLVAAMMLYFMGVAVLPLGEATALFFTAPLLISLLSVPVLGERLGPWRLSAVVIGMIGVLFISQPEFLMVAFGAEKSGAQWGWTVLFPVAGAAFYAACQLTTRLIRASAEASAMAVFQQIVYLVVGLSAGMITLLLSTEPSSNPSVDFLTRGWVMFTWVELAYCAFGAFVTLFLSVASANAYRSAEAAFVAPFEYAALPFAVLWGGVIWGEWPSGLSAIGIGLILGAGLLVLFRERKKNVDLATKAPMPAASALQQQEDDR